MGDSLVKSVSGFTDNLKEIYEYRNVLRALIIKNLFGKYKNTFFGFAWHFFMPLLMLFVYYVVFTEIRTTSFDNFWIFMVSGLFPFNYMLSSLVGGSTAVVDNAAMIKKMYFPREILVLAQTISSFVIMVLGYCVVLVVIAFSGCPLDSVLLLLPFLFILMFIFVLGYSFFFASITVYCRDIQYLLSSISILFFFMTPMFFTVDSVSGLLGTLVWINPFTYYVEACHQIVFFGTMPELNILIACVVLPVFTLLIGIFGFYKLKKGFVERL